VSIACFDCPVLTFCPVNCGIPFCRRISAQTAPFGVTLAAHPPASLLGAVPDGTLRLTCWSWSEGLLGHADTPFNINAWCQPYPYPYP
jgi:hypothetical protein